MTRVLDPRAVVLTVLILTVAAFLADWRVGATLVVLLTAVNVALVPGFRPGIGLAIAAGGLLAFILNVILIQSGQPIDGLSVAGLFITSDGIAMGARFACRVAVLGLVADLARRLTSLDEVPDAVGAMAVPVVGDRAGIHRGIFAIRLALRFLPVVVAEGRDVVTALSLRDLWPRSARGRVRALPRLLLPLWIRTLVRADRLGHLLDARGIDPRAPRRYLPNRRWHVRDTVVVASSLAVAGVACGVGR